MAPNGINIPSLTYCGSGSGTAESRIKIWRFEIISYKKNDGIII